MMFFCMRYEASKILIQPPWTPCRWRENTAQDRYMGVLETWKLERGLLQAQLLTHDSPCKCFNWPTTNNQMSWQVWNWRRPFYPLKTVPYITLMMHCQVEGKVMLRPLQVMGEKTKRQNPSLQVYIVPGVWEKPCDFPKRKCAISGNMKWSKRDYQIRKY